MEYSRVPRFVGHDTVEYGYFPQDKLVDSDNPVCWNEPYYQDENLLCFFANDEQVFFTDGKFYFHCRHGIYEYEPLLWRVFNRKENMLYLISDRVLFRFPASNSDDRFREVYEKEFRERALLFQNRYLEEVLVDEDGTVSLFSDNDRSNHRVSSRIFMPSRFECQRMRAKDLCSPSRKPILKTFQTRFSQDGIPCVEYLGSPFLLSSKYERDYGRLCFYPSKEGIQDFRMTKNNAGVRPCIIIKEENIIKEEM